jgi:hypothetical protein
MPCSTAPRRNEAPRRCALDAPYTARCNDTMSGCSMFLGRGLVSRASGGGCSIPSVHGDGSPGKRHALVTKQGFLSSYMHAEQNVSK